MADVVFDVRYQILQCARYFPRSRPERTFFISTAQHVVVGESGLVFGWIIALRLSAMYAHVSQHHDHVGSCMFAGKGMGSS